ncbi:hypothetical protein LAZ67_6000553 [Cordylochernes scorpioides]|uniref:ENPP1-3/EXOG-like endonuclease/phosphodiesterase domain-containing protein n=1 Tax=Cordylochernes scorpioides TaxID=51811 RepID=A0ABY6KJE2_9ARAC|nr:hypothetical protein LAZ67_6000553 [Cordylochernes scorpioides]
MNSDLYCDILVNKLKPGIRNKRRGKLSKGVLFLHDNARTHTSCKTVSTIIKLGFEVLEHPAYSPDLAPSDYFFFGLLKKELKGKRFDSDEDVQKLLMCRIDTVDLKKYVRYQVVGRNNVAVPTHFFKVILANTGRDYSLETYVLPNAHVANGTNIKTFLKPKEDVERASGLLIFNNIPKQKIRCVNQPDKESLHKLVSRTKELARRIDKMKSEETEIVETYKVNIKLPPFWIERPDIWFHQVEAQFLINNIKTENTKFNYLIAQLEPKYVENLWDIITSKEINKYSEAKERLLRIFKDGESKRIRKLLSGIELGDLKPSQLLQKLRSLATEDLSNKFIKTLWLEKLPQAIQQILIISEEELDKLAVMADRIAELNPKTEIFPGNGHQGK